MMLEKNGLKSHYPIIRNRTGPNTFYITVGNIRNSKYEFLIKSYTEKNDRVELVIL